MMRLILVLISILLLLVSCSPLKTDKLTVVTTVFPLQDFANVVGEEKAEVTSLIKPGVEPHDFDPQPKDVITLQNADVFLTIGSEMEPWAEDLVKGLNNNISFFQAISVSDLYNSDPHVWLDLENDQRMVVAIAKLFSEKDPKNADFYKNNAEEYVLQLQELDAEFNVSLANCSTRVFIVNHAAFGYLSRYNLTQIPIYGLSPDSEPTIKDIEDIVNTAKQNNVSVIFFEELTNPEVVEVIAKEANAKTAMLNPLENLLPGQKATFISLMRSNKDALAEGLNCGPA